MKKRFLLLSVLLSLTLVTSCSNSDEVVEDSSTNAKNSTLLQRDGDIDSGSVSTTWTIGRKSRNCFSIGICKLKKVKVKIESIEATVYGNRMFAGNVKAIDANHFILQVDEENMLDIVNEFGGQYLVLEEGFTIDREEAANLNLAEGFTINAGKYDFVKNISNSLFELQLSN